VKKLYYIYVILLCMYYVIMYHVCNIVITNEHNIMLVTVMKMNPVQVELLEKITCPLSSMVLAFCIQISCTE